jgi:cob(I)alamin adenosyltransferase
MARLKKGFVHLYTGDGKGKTSAAMGLALRAAGAGFSVYIAQFAKGSDTGELKSLEKASKKIVVRQFGTRSFIKKIPTKIDRTLASKAMAEAEVAIAEGKFDVVILDELCIACLYKMVPVAKVVDLIKNKPEHVELVITGRNAPAELVEAADLVTDMRMVKHYFDKGVMARKGIEY